MRVAGLVLMGLLATASPAAAVTITFDSFADGTVLPIGTFDAIGVHFDQNLQVDDGDLGGLAGSAPNYAFNNDTFAGNVTGFFTLFPVSFISVFAGDSGGDTDTVTLNAYNAFNVLVDSDTFTAESAQLLSVTGVGITRFEIIQSGLIAFDDFTFTQDASVPEPATLLLLGSGLAVVARRRMMKKRQ